MITLALTKKYILYNRYIQLNKKIIFRRLNIQILILVLPERENYFLGNVDKRSGLKTHTGNI
jgi:hypothetical protein